jgi:GNAT superfamily N-acetyltransferase
MPADLTDLTDLIIRELTVDEFPQILPLIEQHNPKLDPAELQRRLDAMIPHDYHCIAAFLEGRMVGVAGYWLGARFYCGEYMDVDNVFVLPELRSQGIGWRLMDWLHEKAQELRCKVVMLDSYTTYVDAHRFYLRMGYEILGYHFVKRLPDSPQPA